MATTNYLVCIQCMTYNQEGYITDTMNGFVMQQTDFPFAALIVDDASTDGEQEVIRSYVHEHFDHSQDSGFREWETEDAFWVFAQHSDNTSCHFVTVFLKKNLFKDPDKKQDVVKDWCNAKYMAICEGDDYWTDPLKLQKQVDYLEKHEDVFVCFHKVNVIVPNETEMIEDFHVVDVPGESSIIDLAKIGNYIPTNSALYRNDQRVYADRKRLGFNPIGDYTLWMLCAQYGKIYKLSDNMAVYRYGVGSWQSKPEIYQYMNILNLLNQLRMILQDAQVVRIIDDKIGEWTRQIVDIECEDKEQLRIVKESRAYRIGKAIAKPIKWLRKLF